MNTALFLLCFRFVQQLLNVYQHVREEIKRSGIVINRAVGARDGAWLWMHKAKFRGWQVSVCVCLGTKPAANFQSRRDKKWLSDFDR